MSGWERSLPGCMTASGGLSCLCGRPLVSLAMLPSFDGEVILQFCSRAGTDTCCRVRWGISLLPPGVLLQSYQLNIPLSSSLQLWTWKLLFWVVGQTGFSASIPRRIFVHSILHFKWFVTYKAKLVQGLNSAQFHIFIYPYLVSVEMWSHCIPLLEQQQTKPYFLFSLMLN